MHLIGFVEEYRALLSDGAADEAADREAQVRLIDELGPRLASAVRRGTERKRMSDCVRGDRDERT
jgi:hypothetical protein